MRQEEHRIQCGIVHYLRLNGILCFAVPNGGARNAVTGAKLKAEGVLAGVSDLIAIRGGRPFFIEVKTAKGRQSDEQEAFQLSVEEQGFEYLIWRSIDDAVRWVQNGK